MARVGGPTVVIHEYDATVENSSSATEGTSEGAVNALEGTRDRFLRRAMNDFAGVRLLSGGFYAISSKSLP